MTVHDLVAGRSDVQLDGSWRIRRYPRLSHSEDVQSVVVDGVVDQSGFLAG